MAQEWRGKFVRRADVTKARMNDVIGEGRRFHVRRAGAAGPTQVDSVMTARRRTSSGGQVGGSFAFRALSPSPPTPPDVSRPISARRIGIAHLLVPAI